MTIQERLTRKRLGLIPYTTHTEFFPNEFILALRDKGYEQIDTIPTSEDVRRHIGEEVFFFSEKLGLNLWIRPLAKACSHEYSISAFVKCDSFVPSHPFRWFTTLEEMYSALKEVEALNV